MARRRTSTQSKTDETTQTQADSAAEQHGENGAGGVPVVSSLAEGNVGAAASEATDETTAAAGRLVDQVRSQVTGLIEGQKDRVAGGIETAADLLRTAGGTVRELHQGLAADALEGAADRVEGLAESVRDQDLTHLAEETAAFARRRPAVFAGSALALGFLSARLLRSSGQQEGAEEQTAEAQQAEQAPEGQQGSGGTAEAEATSGAFGEAGDTAPAPYGAAATTGVPGGIAGSSFDAAGYGDTVGDAAIAGDAFGAGTGGEFASSGASLEDIDALAPPADAGMVGDYLSDTDMADSGYAVTLEEAIIEADVEDVPTAPDPNAPTREEF